MKRANNVIPFALMLAVLAASGCKKSQEAETLYVLTVQRAAGVDGDPQSGSSSYAEGATVPYAYTATPGYDNLQVALDSLAVAANGAVTMNSHHALSATADRILYFQGNWRLDFHWTSQTCGLEDASNVAAGGTQNGDAITLSMSSINMTASGTIDLQGNFELTAEMSYANQTKFKFTFTGKMSGTSSFAGNVKATGYLNDTQVCSATGIFNADKI